MLRYTISYLRNNKHLILCGICLSFLIWFAVPVLANGQPPINTDEGYLFYIARQTTEEMGIPGYLPSYMRDNNYPPVIPTILSLLSVVVAQFTESEIAWIEAMQYARLFLQSAVIFLSSVVLYHLVNRWTSRKRLALFCMIAYICSPIIAYRLYYIHATYIANFVAIFFILLALLIIETSPKRSMIQNVLFLSLSFCAVFLTHPFSAFTFGIAILPAYLLFKGRGNLKPYATIIAFATVIALIICSPYLIGIALSNGSTSFQPIENDGEGKTAIILLNRGWSHAHEFLYWDYFSQLFLPIVLPLLLIGSAFGLHKRDRLVIFPLVATFALIAYSYSWLLGGITLIANYRYQTYLIIPFSILTGLALHHMIDRIRIRLRLGVNKEISWRHLELPILIVILVAPSVFFSSATISTYSLDELDQLQSIMIENQISGTIAADPRLSPWLPLLQDDIVVLFSMTKMVEVDETLAYHADIILYDLNVTKKHESCLDLDIDFIVLNKIVGYKDSIRFRGSTTEEISSFSHPLFERVVDSEYWVIFAPIPNSR